MDNALSNNKNSLTDRQQREREFYNTFSNLQNVECISFDPVEGKERRPWNSYWHIYEIARNYYNIDRNKLLDFGCGCGEPSVRFAKIGYNVTSFDISQSSIDIARKLAQKYGYHDQIEFSIQVAEKLHYPSNYFDIIVGFDILHHVDIKLALLECKRVLKTGGIAAFREPVEVPLLDYIRNTKIMKYIFPNEKNFNTSGHITDDERKIAIKDLEIIKSIFKEITEERFYLLSKFDCLFRKYYRGKPSPLEMLDRVMFKIFPILKRYGGDAVFVMKKV